MHAVRFQMFSDYLDYLQGCIGLPEYTKEKKLELYTACLTCAGTKWIDILAPETGAQPIGFLIMGTSPNCHPNADFYIQEAYISPAHRGRGHMASTISKFIQSNPGVYCLFIVRGNESAYSFWKYIFAKNEYAPCYLCDIGAADANCTQYGFRRLCQTGGSR